MSALQAAAAAGEAEVFQFLLEAGAKFAALDSTQWPIMVLAAYGGSAAITQLLVSHGIDVNQTGSDGITPLLAAAMGGHADVTRGLLAAGADPHRRGGVMFGRGGKTALEIAVDNGMKELVHILAAASGLASEVAEDPARAVCRRFREISETSAFQQVLERLAAVCGQPLVPWEKRRGVFRCNVRHATAERVATLQREVLAAGFSLILSQLSMGVSARFLVFPTADKFAVIFARGTNGINKGLTTRAIVTWLRELDEENPFDLTGCGFDFLDGEFRAPVMNAPRWARRMLEFCPDCGSTTTILEEFRKGRFSLWWD
jgi:hypothetical protein